MSNERELGTRKGGWRSKFEMRTSKLRKKKYRKGWGLRKNEIKTPPPPQKKEKEKCYFKTVKGWVGTLRGVI